MTRKGNRAIPKLVKGNYNHICFIINLRKLFAGDIYYNIPYMMPLYMPLPIVLKNDKELKFILRNVVVYGLENTQLSNTK